MCVSYRALEAKVYWSFLRCSWVRLLFAKVRAFHVSSPVGSTTIGRVGTDEGSPRNTITPRRSKTSPQPKPSDQRDEQEFTDLIDMFPEIMSDSSFPTNEAFRHQCVC